MAQKSSGFVLKPVPQSAPSGKGIDLKRAVSVRVRVVKLPKLFVEMLMREMEEAQGDGGVEHEQQQPQQTN